MAYTNTTVRPSNRVHPPLNPMPQVIVVPETEDFTVPVSHENIVWINKNLGVPRLEERGVSYLAPYWITEDFRGVNRVYHIVSHRQTEDGTTEITLGNSFLIVGAWNQMGNVIRFEYHDLESFGLEEIGQGLLRTQILSGESAEIT